MILGVPILKHFRVVKGQIRENVLKNEYAEHVRYKQFVICLQN